MFRFELIQAADNMWILTTWFPGGQREVKTFESLIEAIKHMGYTWI